MCARVSWQRSVMKCLACGAEMLLMQVVKGDATRAPAFERRIFMCSACRHIARRLVFSRAKMPSTNLPVVITHPEAPATKLQMERVAAPSAWAKAVEKLGSRQTALKEGAAAAKTAVWTKAVEKLRSKQAALAEQAAVASRLKLAEPVQAPAAPSEPSGSPPACNEPPCASERLGARG